MLCTPKPNGFADQFPYEKWLAIIGNINPTFSDTAIWKFQIQQIQAEFFGEDSSCLLAPNLRAAAVDEELQPFKYPQWANMNG